MFKFSPSGQKIEVRYGYKVDKNGIKIFTEVGKLNVVERIKVAGLGTSLYEMIEKFAKTGDDSFLRAKASAMNTDLTVMPKTLIELYQLKNTCLEDFNQFPVDYRALFNHSVDDYIKAIQDNTVVEITDKYFKDKAFSLKSVDIEGEQKKDE